MDLILCLIGNVLVYIFLSDFVIEVETIVIIFHALRDFKVKEKKKKKLYRFKVLQTSSTLYRNLI